MRLHWFAPLPPAETDIAQYTARLLPELRRQADITLWTDQSEWDPALEEYAPVRRFDLHGVPWSDLNRADLCVYHIGNNPRFHIAIWEVSRRHPGLVVLHDPCVQEFFAGMYARQQNGRAAHVATMARYYGRAGQDAGDRFWRGELSVYELGERYPLSALASADALGALVHSRSGFDMLKREAPCPLVLAPLPYPARLRTPQDRLERLRARAGRERYRLVVFGFLGRNRGLEPLLQALGQFGQRDRFRLHIYGPLWDPDRVRATISSLKLDQTVLLYGYTPPTRLDEALARAHLAINLRYPTMGESSGSQLRIWDHALPSLVTRIGWYAGIPEDAVAFVRPGHEVEDVQAHLADFLNDPVRFAKMGRRGRQILERRHNVEPYVGVILRFAEEAPGYRTCAAAYRLAGRAGAEMGIWADGTTPDAVYVRTATAIQASIAG